jgi:DNA-binding CsgD family transcriptional regulator
MDRLTQDDAALFAAARVSRDLARLSGAPAPDWCERAALALTQAAPGTRAWVAVVRPGPAGGRAVVERSGYSGKSECDAAQAREVRDLARAAASGLARPVRAGVHTLAELAPATRSRLVARHPELVVGVVPLPVGEDPGESAPLLLAQWETCAGAGECAELSCEDLRRVLRTALPVLAERSQLALGAGRSPWLSVREHRVLELLIGGLSVPEIAAILGRSQHTVHDYVKSLHRKLGTSTRGGLVARALGHECAPSRHAGRRGPRGRPAPMLAFRTDGRTAFVDHWLC